MSDLPIDQKDDLDQDLEAVTRVLTIVHQSTFTGAGAKSVLDVINFLSAIRYQIMTKLEDNNNFNGEPNGPSEK